MTRGSDAHISAVVQATTLSLSHAFDEIDQTGELTSVFHVESMNVLCRRYLDVVNGAKTLRAEFDQLLGEMCFVKGHDIPATEQAAKAALVLRAHEAEAKLAAMQHERDTLQTALNVAYEHDAANRGLV